MILCFILQITCIKEYFLVLVQFRRKNQMVNVRYGYLNFILALGYLWDLTIGCHMVHNIYGTVLCSRASAFPSLKGQHHHRPLFFCCFFYLDFLSSHQISTSEHISNSSSYLVPMLSSQGKDEYLQTVMLSSKCFLPFFPLSKLLFGLWYPLPEQSSLESSSP